MVSTLEATLTAMNQALFTSRNMDVIASTFAAGYRVHLSTTKSVQGHAGIRAALDTYRRGFSDIEVDVEVLVETEERVSWRRTFRAVHVGRFQNFPPTGAPITWQEMVVSKFADGLIVEEWLVSNLAEHLLGARKQR